MTTITSLTTRDGLELHLRHWPLPAGHRPRGQVVLVHGLGEHIGRYVHVAAMLNAAGWDVTGYDQRGHGRSPGPRGGLAQGDDLLWDLAALVDHLRHQHPDQPLVLLGHSMGGLLVGRFVAEQAQPAGAPRAGWARPVDALVMSSPALDPGMNALQKQLLGLMGAVAPNTAVGNGLDPAWVSRDAAVVAAYKADPMVHDRVTAKLVRFIVDGGEVTRARAAAWNTPTLLMWAGADRCVAPRGSAAFANAAPPDVVAHHEFAQLSHEIFNEPEQAQVLQRLREWLDLTFPR